MPSEHCWGCKQRKQGVVLRSTDDRLCNDCFDENERQLLLQRMNTPSVVSDAINDLATAGNTTTALIPPMAVSSEATTAAAAAKGPRKQPNRSVKAASAAPTIPSSADNSASSSKSQQPNASPSPLIPQSAIQNNAATASSNTPLSLALSPSADSVEISALHLIVQQQQATINSLQRQLDFVLSFLGIADPSAQHPTSSEAGSNNSDQQSLTIMGPVQQTKYESSSAQSGSMSYSHAVSHDGARQSLQQIVLSTIDAENKRKQSRQKNVIISGLPSSSQQPDSELVEQLLCNELQISSSIRSCQRLGKPSQNKTQPVRVSLASQQEAIDILALAKRLRSSADNYISKNVYINKDLTKAEAEAAYNERCRRRTKETKQQGNHPQQSDTALPLTDQPLRSNNIPYSVPQHGRPKPGKQC